MNTKLLLLSIFTFASAAAQAPVASYYGTNDATFSIVDNTGVNHAQSGANTNWHFVGLNSIGTSVDTESVPTAGEIADFPGTTAVVTTNSSYDDATTATFKVYSKSPSNALSITGIDNEELLLKYNTNNALLGTFPLNYGYSFSDNVGGNYDNGEYAGTFSGTIVTSVDAWGALSIGGLNINPFAGQVTRLKTLQNLSINYGIFTNVGTITVTTYSYYDATMFPVGVPRFRSTITTVNVPLLSINQTVTQNEAFLSVLLGTEHQTFTADAIAITPNPVAGALSIQSNSQKIQSIILTDMAGKIILTDRSKSNSIDVGHLRQGVYFARIETDRGTTVKKFVKK